MEDAETIRVVNEAQDLYELEQRKGVIRDRVRDVAVRRHPGTYMSGPSGTSKTYLVRKTLQDLGVTYLYHAGHVTPMGYFYILKKHPDEILVFDDVSSLFHSPVGKQLLLASLGSQYGHDGQRKVTYERRGSGEIVHFTGGVIAISNMELHDEAVMNAIKSRTNPLRWDPSRTQLAAMMREGVYDGWQRNGVILSPEECQQVVDFVVAESSKFGVPLDLRLLFDMALPDFAASRDGEHEVDWRDHVTMRMCERVQNLKFSGSPKTRAQRKELEQKLAERIRASHNTRKEQVEAWSRETGKSERAYDRRAAELKLAK